MTTTKEIERLEELFKLVNKEIFKNEIVTVPVITFNPDEKGKTLGHFITGEIWENRNKQKATELNIVCSVKRDKNGIIETMIHEMVHLYAYEKKIKDTSNKGVYHNKEYKRIAEEHGLKVTKTRYGWNQTELNETGKAFAKNCKIALGQMNRGLLTKQTKKQKAYKYECPCCKAKWRTTKELKLFCAGQPDNIHELRKIQPEEINGEDN